jgi:propanol-preferring alcohol dehydrogenase
MKAWILEKQDRIENRPIRLIELPTPHPGHDEIRIKVHSCGVCRTDVHVAEGDLPLKKSPLILGHEVVGAVDEIGKNVNGYKIGDRVGVPWLYSTCGKCSHCLSGRENLCRSARFTGWSEDGGYAQYMIAPADFVLQLNFNISSNELAPLLCPGIAGYRALKLTQINNGGNLGLYGFGPTAAYILQMAQFLGIKIYVITRSEKNMKTARELGAEWIGNYKDELPCKLTAGILFPPVGDLVEFALSQLDRGGRLVLAPVTSTPIAIQDYNHIWMERSITSLANITREDGREFLKLSSKINIKTKFQTFNFNELPDVLIRVKHGEINGNAVIHISD